MPDRLMITASEAGISLSPSALEDAYQTLGQTARDARLLSCWRLLALPEEVMGHWLQDQAPLDELLPEGFTVRYPDPSPLAAVLALQLLESQPSLRDAYFDLELQSELAGTNPDTQCLARYRQHCDAAALLQTWHSQSEESKSREQQCSQLEAQIAQLQEELHGATDAVNTLQQQLLVEQEEGQLSALRSQQLQDELQRIYQECLSKNQHIKQIESINEGLKGDKDRLSRRLQQTSVLLSQATQVISMLRTRWGQKANARRLPKALLPPWKD